MSSEPSRRHSTGGRRSSQPSLPSQSGRLHSETSAAGVEDAAGDKGRKLELGENFVVTRVLVLNTGGTIGMRSSRDGVCVWMCVMCVCVCVCVLCVCVCVCVCVLCVCVCVCVCV